MLLMILKKYSSKDILNSEYFDESKSFYSNAYYNFSNEIKSDYLQFAKLDKGGKINLREF